MFDFVHTYYVNDPKSEVLTSLEYYHSTLSHLVLMLHHQLEWSDEWVVLSLADCVLSTLIPAILVYFTNYSKMTFSTDLEFLSRRDAKYTIAQT